MHATSSKIFVTILALALVSSFGLHAVQVEHTHVGGHHTHDTGHADFQNMNNEYLHFGDKKIFLVVVLVATFFGMFLMSRSWGEFWRHLYLGRFHSLCAQWTYFVAHYHSYLQTLFQKGLLHPKYF